MKSLSLSRSAGQRQSRVDFDRKSFVIDGERVFLQSASIHYFRMPRAEWRETLVKAKLAGMNSIDTYFAWNVHEPEEGQWRFEGDANCGAFLDLCAELGLWVIARPGPFICAEWDFGGFPWWLGRKEGIRFRETNETFLRAVDIYFDRIGEIIRDRQLGAGGTVILVQVENEYGYLADDEASRPYMAYLRDGWLRRGIEVPLITCAGGVEGAVEGANFWSGADSHFDKLARKQPDAPKIVTEFWSGWFEHWGAPAAIQKTPELYEKRMLEIIRAGFSGISHYMFFGGTNFAGYGGRTVGASDVFMVTSYGYDAPLDEYGRTTPKYFAAKRLACLVQAIEPFLLESEPLDAAAVRASAGLDVRGRRLGDQRLLLVESGKEERETFHLTLEDGRTLPVIVHPGEIAPVLVSVDIGGGLRLTSTASLACNEPVGGVRTLIVHARDGLRSFVELTAAEPIRLAGERPQLASWSPDGRTVSFDLYHFREPQRIELTIGGEALRLIVLSGSEMDRTWRLGAGRWLFGCDDVDLTPAGERQFQVAVSRAAARLPQPPALLDWSSAALELDGIGGMPVDRPRDFTSWGQPYGYLLYSCEIEREREGWTTLILPKLEDPARAYVNGTEAALIREVGSAAVRLHLRQGSNRLQLLVQNMGRLNFSPDLGEPKGLFDTGYVDGVALDLRAGWKADDGETEAAVHLDRVSVVDGQPSLSRMFSLDGQDRALLVGAVAVPLRVNGRIVPLEGYQNWFAHRTVDLSAYVQQGRNVIEMPYFKSPIPRLELLAYRSADSVGGWSMAGIGEERPEAAARLGAAAATAEEAGAARADGAARAAGKEAAAAAGTPAWHACEFAAPSLPETLRPRLKLRLTGMSKGSIWLNGIDLGRYWQIGPQEDYKIPMSWLQERNRLVLFDEQGRSPDRVRLLYDEASAREWEPHIE